MSTQIFFPEHRGNFTPEPGATQRYRNPFNDFRLYGRFKQLSQDFCGSPGCYLTDLSDERCVQVAAARFINNPRVDVEELIYQATLLPTSRVKEQACLVYLDATAVNVSLNAGGRPELLKQLGCIDNQGRKPGYTAMPAVVVDQKQQLTIGLSDIIIYSRPVHDPDPKINRQLRQQRQKLSFAQKESSAWAIAVDNTMKQLESASQVCFISDQGSDIFEFYERLEQWPGAQFIIRAKNNRQAKVCCYDKFQRLDELLDRCPIASQRKQFIPALDNFSKTEGKKRQRLARLSKLDLRYVQAWMYPPADKNGKVTDERAILLTYVDVQEEQSGVPAGEKPIHWRLATNRTITCLEEAWQVVEDYAGRWTIEQLFRTLKLDGLDVERSQFDQPEALKRLLIMSLSTVVKTQQLVQLRNDQNDVELLDIFTDKECQVLRQINSQLEGKTEKMKNPYLPNKAAYGSWIVGRLGGWSGYQSEKPPGYKRMARGMSRLRTIVKFYPIDEET